MKIWLNGDIIDASSARIDPCDRGFLLGDGLFETMRVRSGRAAWLDRHMERLGNHAKRIGLDTKSLPSSHQVEIAIRALGEDLPALDAVARLTVTRGCGPRGLLPPKTNTSTSMITLTEFTLPRPDAVISLATSRDIRRNPWSVVSQVKSTNYLDNIVARQSSEIQGADDALILSVDGNVAEVTIANICAITNGALKSPGPESGALAGLGRAFILEQSQREGVATADAPLHPTDLLNADIVFICNALQGPRRVGHIDAVKLQTSPTGYEIFEKLQARFEAEHSEQTYQ